MHLQEMLHLFQPFFFSNRRAVWLLQQCRHMPSATHVPPAQPATFLLVTERNWDLKTNVGIFKVRYQWIT